VSDDALQLQRTNSIRTERIIKLTGNKIPAK